MNPLDTASNSEYELEMFKMANEYQVRQNVSILCVTWNVNSKLPDRHAIQRFYQCSPDQPTIVVVCIQEMDMNKASIVLNEAKNEQYWLHAIVAPLQNTHERVAVRRLAGIYIDVLVEKSSVAHVKFVSTSWVADGVLGVFGNKGAVGASLLFGDCLICFVSSHFAAHQDEIEKRNQNFHNIMSKMAFYDPRKKEGQNRIEDHNLVIWAGDLNYRLSDVMFNQVRVAVSEVDFSFLLNYDQLSREMCDGKVFNGYREAAITFLPTYKYRHIEEFDAPGYAKNSMDAENLVAELVENRIPSWCDRILYSVHEKCDPIISIRQTFYRSLHEIRTSDHKPVLAHYQVAVSMVDPDKKARISTQIRAVIDQKSNQSQPSAMLSAHDLHFGHVHLLKPKPLTLTIHNDGPCDFIYHFKSKLGTVDSLPDWLHFSCKEGVIKKGRSAQVTFTIKISFDTVKYFINSVENTLKNNELSEIFILSLQGGKDYFICVTADYVPSCFGVELTKLLALKCPIKLDFFRRTASMTMDDILFMGSLPESVISENAESVHRSTPTEFWQMLEYLMRKCADFECLIDRGGMRKEENEPGLAKLIEHLDNREEDLDVFENEHRGEFDVVGVVATGFFLFLEMLPQPLIKRNVTKIILNHNSLYNLMTCSDLLKNLPEENRKLITSTVILLGCMLNKDLVYNREKICLYVFDHFAHTSLYASYANNNRGMRSNIRNAIIFMRYLIDG